MKGTTTLRVSHDEHHAHYEHKEFFIIPEVGACAARSALAYPSETPLKATKIIIEDWCIIETNKYMS